MKRGFTLIELLVVVAIIGMLSSVVLSSLNQARSGARDARRAQDIKQFQAALELYYNDNNSYPVSGWAHSSGGTNWTNLQTALSSYITSLPTDPINTAGGAGYNNDQYVYSYYASGYGGSGQWYMIIWELENSNQAFEGTDGVTACNGQVFHYGSGTDGRVSTGGTCAGQ
ncbi:MAG: type II secretion system protein [Patescibacteria group bacterium UBA2103]